MQVASSDRKSDHGIILDAGVDKSLSGKRSINDGNIIITVTKSSQSNRSSSRRTVEREEDSLAPGSLEGSGFSNFKQGDFNHLLQEPVPEKWTKRTSVGPNDKPLSGAPSERSSQGRTGAIFRLSKKPPKPARKTEDRFRSMPFDNDNRSVSDMEDDPLDIDIGAVPHQKRAGTLELENEYSPTLCPKVTREELTLSMTEVGQFTPPTTTACNNISRAIFKTVEELLQEDEDNENLPKVRYSEGRPQLRNKKIHGKSIWGKTIKEDEELAEPARIDFRVRSVNPNRKRENILDISSKNIDDCGKRQRAITVAKLAPHDFKGSQGSNKLSKERPEFSLACNFHPESPTLDEITPEIKGRVRSNVMYFKTPVKSGSLKTSPIMTSTRVDMPPMDSLFESFVMSDSKNLQTQCKKQQASIRSLCQHLLFYPDSVTDTQLAAFVKEIHEDVVALKGTIWPCAPKALAILSDILQTKKILLLDLDETLVHSQFDSQRKQLHVRVRPYAREFLEHCSKRWNLIAFTASSRSYAESILDRLDPLNQYVSNILSREHCQAHGTRFVKDFRMVVSPNIPQDKLLMIDNRVSSFAMNLKHGLPILPFRGEESDKELRSILPILDHLSRPDVSISEWVSSRYCYSIFESPEFIAALQSLSKE